MKVVLPFLLALPAVGLVALSVLAAPSAQGASAPSGAAAAPASTPARDLWALAQRHLAVHRFSTLFTAQNVREYLSSDARLAEAIDWCKRTAVTKVYIEEFRGAYTADRATLIKARDAFRRRRHRDLRLHNHHPCRQGFHRLEGDLLLHRSPDPGEAQVGVRIRRRASSTRS